MNDPNFTGNDLAWAYSGKNYSESFEVEVAIGENIYFDLNTKNVETGELVNTKYTVEYVRMGPAPSGLPSYTSNAAQAYAYDQFFHPGDTQFGGDGTWMHYYQNTNGTFDLMTYAPPSGGTGWQNAYIPSTDYNTQVKPTYDGNWANLGTNYYFGPIATVTKVARGFKVPTSGRVRIDTMVQPANGSIYAGDGFKFSIFNNSTPVLNQVTYDVNDGSFGGSSWDFTGNDFTQSSYINVTANDTIFFVIDSGTISGSEVVNTKYTVSYVDPLTPLVVSGVSEGSTYDLKDGNVSITYNKGSAKLNTYNFVSGSQIARTGSYSLVATDPETNTTTTVNFTVIDTTPIIVSGVEDGITYNNASGPITISFNMGTATLNNNPFTNGSSINATGSYKLIATRADFTTTINFSYIKRGDVTGDGVIDLSDLVSIRKDLLKVTPLDGVYKSAGDLYAKGKITISDLIGVKKHLLGITSLLPKIEVFLLAGQSNMVGQGIHNELPSNLLNVNTNVRAYAGGQLGHPEYAEKWLKLNDQLGAIDFGPEFTFGLDMEKANPNKNIALIKWSVGGTDLANDWNPSKTGGLYENFRSAVTTQMQVLSQDYDPAIMGMLWMQGEGDTLSLETANAYEQNLSNFISTVKSDLHCPDLKMVLGRISDSGAWPYRAQVRMAQQNIADADPNISMVNTDDLTRDLYHYDTAGLITLGSRFATAMLELLG